MAKKGQDTETLAQSTPDTPGEMVITTELFENMKGQITELKGTLTTANETAGLLREDLEDMGKELEAAQDAATSDEGPLRDAKHLDAVEDEDQPKVVAGVNVKGYLLMDIDGAGKPDKVVLSGISLPLNQLRDNPGKFKNAVGDALRQGAFQGITKWLKRRLSL